jgi:hypothetical protein
MKEMARKPVLDGSKSKARRKQSQFFGTLILDIAVKRGSLVVQVA